MLVKFKSTVLPCIPSTVLITVNQGFPENSARIRKDRPIARGVALSLSYTMADARVLWPAYNAVRHT